MRVYETANWDSDKSEFDHECWVLMPGEQNVHKVEERFGQLLDRLGSEGWELVGQLTMENGILLNVRGLHTGGVATGVFHTFKRVKSS